jgi:hypothetical protein
MPDSIVFSSRSYEDVCRDTRAQNLLRSILTRDTVVFVGCGAGNDDPNFGGLLEWSREALRSCQHTHYHLVRQADLSIVAEQCRGLPITPIPYGENYTDLAPFATKIGAKTQSRRLPPDPINILRRFQSDYDAQVQDLRQRRDEISTGEFVHRNFELDRELWRTGGRRVAALHMENTMTSAGKNLPARERLQFGLEAVEHLLEDDLDAHATFLLHELDELLSGWAADTVTLARFRQLQARCLSARAALDQALQAINSAMPLVAPNDRARLEAERAELHLLSGDLDEAITPARKMLTLSFQG